MSQRLHAMLTGAALLAVCVLGVIVFSGDAGAQQQGGGALPSGVDLIMVRCNVLDANFTPTGYKGTTDAPSKRGESCPETLSQTFKEGFRIREISRFEGDKPVLIFTLVRARG